MSYDDSGWVVVPPTALDPATCYSLLSPEHSSRIDIARWQHQAKRFFDFEVTIEPAKSYPSDGYPLADRCTLTWQRGSDRQDVALITLPLDRAPQVVAAAERAVDAIGGAGFDVLVHRAVRLWQLQGAPTARIGEAVTSCAALLASVLLAPVLDPSGRSIYGVKGARERLDALRRGR